MSYFDRLVGRIEATSALCVGIDPHPGVLRAWGVSEDATGAERVALGMVEALADQVAAFKPQSAFFEQWGSAGVAVLERCLTAIKASGALAILDVKRGDIGSTMAAYAQAYLGDGPLAADAITVSPYLGFGALGPAIELAEANHRGVYVLARTSNPEGAEIQQGRTTGGDSVAQSIVNQAAAGNRASGLGAIGLVIGGTHAEIGLDLRQYHGSILIPGIGTQGGTISGLHASFPPTPAVLLPSVSREVLLAGPDPSRLRAGVAKLLAG